jgi:hypothetical protein
MWYILLSKNYFVLLGFISDPARGDLGLKVVCIFSGSLGQLGVELARFLRGIYGRENVIMSDIIKPSTELFNEGSYRLSLCLFS